MGSDWLGLIGFDQLWLALVRYRNKQWSALGTLLTFGIFTIEMVVNSIISLTLQKLNFHLIEKTETIWMTYDVWGSTKWWNCYFLSKKCKKLTRNLPQIKKKLNCQIQHPTWRCCWVPWPILPMGFITHKSSFKFDALVNIIPQDCNT